MIDLVAELDALLAAWRERRAPKLADAIEELGSWFDLAAPPLAGRTKPARHTAWLAYAKPRRAVDLGELLSTGRYGTSEQVTAQLEVISAWSPDPRTTRFVRWFFEMKPFATSSGTQKVWRRLFDVIAQHGDPQIQHSLWPSEMAKVFDRTERGQKMRQRASNVLAELEQIRVVELDDDHARADSLASELQSGRALRDAVRGHHNEEGEEQQYADALLVYRDWLMERGFTVAA